MLVTSRPEVVPARPSPVAPLLGPVCSSNMFLVRVWWKRGCCRDAAAPVNLVMVRCDVGGWRYGRIEETDSAESRPTNGTPGGPEREFLGRQSEARTLVVSFQRDRDAQSSSRLLT